MIGGRVIRLATVESTNDEAARLAEAGEPEGTVVVADEQRRGRGRQGRPWQSPAGTGICCSVILRPERPVREWPDLSWVLAAAVASFARECGAAAVVKFPNDVLVGGRKLAGLLLETRTGAGDAKALIAGIGLNVTTGEEQFPAEIRGIATSLALLTGRREDCATLLGPLCAQLEGWYALWSRSGSEAARGAMAAALGSGEG